MVKWYQSLNQTVWRTKQTLHSSNWHKKSLNVCNKSDINWNIPLGGLVIVGEGCLRYFPLLPACLYHSYTFTLQFSLFRNIPSSWVKLLKSWKSWKYWKELGQRLVNLTWYYHLLLLGMVLLFPRQRRISFLFFFRKVGIFYLLLNFLIKRETLQWIKSVHDWRLRGFPETSHQWRKQHRNFPWMLFAI